MAKIQIREVTDTTIKVRMIELDTNWSQGTRYCYWDCSEDGYPDVDPNNYWKRISLSDGVSTGGGTTFTGLNPNTTYYITCAIYKASDMSYIWDFPATATTKEPEIVIDYWSWTTSNGSASASQTQKAYTAITSQGKITDFSYLVWNDMVDKAVEILNASGKTWLTKNANTGATYATAANTKMTSSDREMTALRFNSLKFQIGNKIGTGTTKYPSGIQDVERGDKILGEYFVIFGSKFNDWIDSVL